MGCFPHSLRRNPPRHTSASDFQSVELRVHQFAPFRPPRLAIPVKADVPGRYRASKVKRSRVEEHSRKQPETHSTLEIKTKSATCVSVLFKIEIIKE